MSNPKELREWAENACDHTPQFSREPMLPRALCCVARDSADEWEKDRNRLVEVDTIDGMESLLQDAEKWRYAIQSCEADFEEKIMKIGARGFVIFQKDRVQMDKDKEDVRKWREQEKEKFREAYIEQTKTSWNGITNGMLDGARDRANNAEKERDRYREALLEIANTDPGLPTDGLSAQPNYFVEVAKEALAPEKP